MLNLFYIIASFYIMSCTHLIKAVKLLYFNTEYEVVNIHLIEILN